MQAKVYKSTGSWYVVKTQEGELFNARIKGVFKIDNITSTNPVAVGDDVILEFEEIERTAIITEICGRKNYIARTSPHNKNQHHIIAANLDQALLFATLKDPKTSGGFIDRFLITAEAYHIPALVVFNKSDLYKKKEIEQFENYKAVYEAAGYKVLLVSAKNNEGISSLKEMLRSKNTLLSGHSGVGKSTFINVLFPEMNLRTQQVSNWSGKGMHTTTFAEMFDIEGGGAIIDTPGIREFGIIDIEKQELSHYFPEMRSLIHNCQFNNCLHVNEPGCAVKGAVEKGKMHVERYMSYCNVLETISTKKY